MNRHSVPLLLCVGLLLGPPSAEAKELEPDQVRRITLEYASCIVKQDHRKASEALLANANNATISDDFRRLIDGDCLPTDAGSIAFGADLYRYALADALVAAEFSEGGPNDFSDRLPLAHLPIPTQADIDAALAKAKSAKKRDRMLAGFESARGVAVLSQYGECVVRQNPQGARLWLLTKPGTPQEDGRIDALRPAFADCLADGSVAFSKATMRGTVALNYYRLAHAPIQPTAGKTE